MDQKLEYINQGRGGYVIYKENTTELKFFFEFGGGNCIAIIYIPTIEEWERKTNTSLQRREEIAEFVATQSIKDQAPNCTYQLQDHCIELILK